MKLTIQQKWQVLKITLLPKKSKEKKKNNIFNWGFQIIILIIKRFPHMMYQMLNELNIVPGSLQHTPMLFD
jgi:hypothetical protein